MAGVPYEVAQASRGCLRDIRKTIDRYGGLLVHHDSMRQFGSTLADGTRQMKLF